MASGKRPPSDGSRRRRPSAVIDLKATEVVEPAAAESRADAPAPPPQPAAVSPSPQVSTPLPEAPFIPPSPEPPYQAASARGPSGPPPPEPPPRDPPPGPPPSGRSFAWLPEELSWSQASAGIAGASGAVLAVLLLWLFGAFSSGRDHSADLSPRLASIERQLRDLAARPVPASVDPKAIDEIAARLTRLESAQSTPRAPVTDPVVLGRLSAAEQSAKSLADNVAALSRRGENVEGALRETQARVERMASALEALRDTQSRLDKMSAALEELRTHVREASAGNDPAARLAAAAAALRSAVERGDPFVAEFAVVKPLASDAAALKSLEPFAAIGVPRNAALANELATLVKPMLQAASPSRDGNFIERLQANAEKLVRVRPIGEATGDDRSAILTRIETRASQADVPGALAELAKLPTAERAPFQPWIAKAEARQHAIEASRRLAADSVAALRATP